MVKRGFTLFEVLLIIAIVAAVFVISAPYDLEFYRGQLTGDAQANIIDALQRARHNAVLQKNDSDFGVHIEAPNYVIFQGSDYNDRVMEQDEVFPLVDSLTFGGPTDIVFSKLTGVPSATGTITISYGSISRDILIGDSGSVSKAE